jgi:hypothetical protein
MFEAVVPFLAARRTPPRLEGALKVAEPPAVAKAFLGAVGGKIAVVFALNSAAPRAIRSP